jgi:hypothetical protein
MSFPETNGLIRLEESTHKYILSGHEDIEFTSVTSCISEYFEKFDKEKVAAKLVSTVPKYRDKTANQLIEEWNETAVLSLYFGTVDTSLAATFSLSNFSKYSEIQLVTLVNSISSCPERIYL